MDGGRRGGGSTWTYSWVLMVYTRWIARPTACAGRAPLISDEPLIVMASVLLVPSLAGCSAVACGDCGLASEAKHNQLDR
ncbi:hypothetical protein D9M68_950490 [compost metagenome]